MDRELLEWAAKAAGLTTTHKWNAERLEMTPPVLALVVHRDGELVSTGWNPLADDGDALRMAVRLNIPVIPYDDETSTGTVGVVAKNWGSKEENTRRAIVRAAAEIGKSGSAASGQGGGM